MPDLRTDSVEKGVSPEPVPGPPDRGAGSDGAPVGATQVVLAGASVTYRSADGELRALDRTDLTIPAGQFLCVVGPSGCGKTTLLQLVAGFLSPTEGEVTVGGAPVTGPAPDRGVVFQKPELFPWLTVRGNVEFGLRMRHVRRSERRERAEAQLRRVGLADVADMRPYELSGGMQQRCQIARVLANDPRLLLMDEPFGALDALTREHLQNELLELRDSSPTTVIFITHSVEEAVHLADRIVVMSPRPGRVILDVPGPFAGRHDRPDDARTRPDVIECRRLVRSAITEDDNGR